ncbi:MULTISPECIES: OmpA family protein [Shimia]|uniref:OmpA family protein n=1 Tax=Shimia TaxID=573139 RepID=UPI001FB474EF|nr:MULTISPECIES: OmpA family protein [Shimia]MDV4144520.1 OmpA family protein [Shimia sp. FJ5]
MKKSILSICALSLAGVTACTDPAYVTGDGEARDEYRQAKQGAIFGGILGAGIAAVTDSNVAVGAAVGAGAGALVGSALDKQEAELREDLDDDVQIENTGDRLIVTLPQDILFASDSYAVQPGLTDDLRVVAQSLQKYPNSIVQVIGHTDNTASAEYNQNLSELRAEAVADKLMDAGVAFDRIETIGRGESDPVASNLSEAGKAQNRRVEIVILPQG